MRVRCARAINWVIVLDGEVVPLEEAARPVEGYDYTVYGTLRRNGRLCLGLTELNSFGMVYPAHVFVPLECEGIKALRGLCKDYTPQEIDLFVLNELNRIRDESGAMLRNPKNYRKSML